MNERLLGPLTVAGVWLDPTKTLQQNNVKNNVRWRGGRGAAGS